MLIPAVTELLARVTRHPAVDETLESLRRGSPEQTIAGLTDPVKALLAVFAASETRRPVLILTDTSRAAEEMIEPLRFFQSVLGGPSSGSVVLLPALDRLPGEGVGPHPDILETRASALWRFVTGQAAIVVAPVAASLLTFASPRLYEQLSRSLSRDEDVPLEEVVASLVRAGYVRTDLVERPGEFAVRGGILDVFPPEAQSPVRIELLGDTIESLREFDPETQRSVGLLHRLVLPPLTEFPVGAPVFPGSEEADGAAGNREGENRFLQSAGDVTLFDLRDELLVVLIEPEAVEKAAVTWRERLQQAAPREDRTPALLTESDWQSALGRHQRLSLERLGLRRAEQEPKTLGVQPTTRYHGQIPAFLAEVRGRLAARGQVLIAAASTGEMERLADLCREYEVPYKIGEIEQSATGLRLAEEGSSSSTAAVVLVRAPLSEGFVVPDVGLAFYGTGDLFETLPVSERPRARPKTASFYSDFSELKPGNYVVHVDHGIGQFDGLQTIESDGRRGEFMRLVYADDARLYVPLERMDLVQVYRSLEGAKPQLDRLGGTAWTSRKKRASKSLTDLADKLLELYADRKSTQGFAFSADTPWQHEFEDAFEFVETPDQAAAITEVKRDMERAQPMDRLLCGDVGYGKTEVALRAAFKAISDSKQVAVLAPTTVLVFQHYETFRRRMAAFPVRIGMLSRFRSARQQKKTLAELEEGKVDIIIGTHRLLSRDVRFHDLGLLVVDEEQRFGVTHKERLKEISRNVHVLTMTATPIPRTLNMSLVGLRDMSIIETPPKDRLAIQTVVAPFSEALVQRAVSDELERGGQVFFVHNRVESIYSLAKLLQTLVPKARIVVGHGQMGDHELEDVMMKFVRNEADVLVSTTIVENGLDIPRANTIVINRADRFGLSELYQLRGRVGRSNQRAYAYLLVPQEETVSTLAGKRLSALREFSELGAGFRIAALDLELRGAGNLLGREQHGHIGAIGFDLYCQMLERAVANKRGQAGAPELRATLNLGFDIRIPPEYIPSENLRLRTYKRIAGITAEPERDAVRQELADRFGPPPLAVENLLSYALLKSFCERLQISSVERRGMEVALKFHPTTPVRPEHLVKLVHKQKGMRLHPSGVLTMTLDPGTAKIAETIRNVLHPLEAGS
jgi:transcription-repair coupling factor (superfamily II helicase)